MWNCLLEGFGHNLWRKAGEEVTWRAISNKPGIRLPETHQQEKRVMKVRDIASKALPCCQLSASIAQVASMMDDYDVDAVAVCVGGEVIGVLTDANICLHSATFEEKHPQQRVIDLIAAAPLSVSVRPDADFSDAVEIMLRNRISHLPVVDVDRAVGSVTLRDIGIALSRADGFVAADAQTSLRCGALNTW
jgi:CBS domain-containing protein